MNNIRIFAIVAGALITGMSLLNLHSLRIDAENNEFAKECNTRGGIARWVDGMLQCLGSEKAPSPKADDSHKGGAA